MVTAVAHVAASWAPRRRSRNANAGPISKTIAARIAGRRSAANDSPRQIEHVPHGKRFGLKDSA